MATFEYLGYRYRPTAYSPSGTMYYICDLVGICFATGKKTQDGRFDLIRPHMHLSPGEVEQGNHVNKNVIEMHVLKDKLKEKAAGPGRFRDLYAETVKEYPFGAALYSKLSAISLMNQVRASGFPVEPNLVSDLDQLFTNDELSSFSINNELIYNGYAIDYNGNYSSFFTCCNLLNLVLNQNPAIMYIDCSFKMVPVRPKSKQLLSVHFQINNNSFPVIYCLMGDNTPEAYYSVIYFIKRCILPNYCPHTIYTDLNTDLIRLLTHFFGDANIDFSWFHHNQNLYEKMIDFGYSNLLITCEKTRNCFKMLLLLPLLPPNYIQNGIDVVKSAAYEWNTDILMIINFYTTNWLQQIGPNSISVYLKPQKTLNNIEIFHRELFGTFKDYPTIWTFLGSVQNFSNMYLQAANQLYGERNHSNNTVHCKLIWNYPIVEQNIRRLIIGEITVKDFLSNCSCVLDDYETQIKAYTKKMAIHMQDQHYFGVDIENDDILDDDSNYDL